MKKIAIFVLFLAIALSYSCKKEEKTVATSINGTLIVNGTNDPIKISKELKKPIVLLYHEGAGAGIPSGPKWDEVARTNVDKDAKFSFNLDLIDGDSYYLGFYDVDKTYYINLPKVDNWYAIRFFPVTAGQNNNIKLYVLAYSWVRPRFINTNPDPNNSDVFDCPTWGISFSGPTDSVLTWVYKTWSGTNMYGIPPGNNNYDPHKVYGKLTRNGVTIDTSIIYSVPPYDTTVVEIRY